MTDDRINNDFALLIKNFNDTAVKLREKWGREESSKNMMISFQVLIDTMYQEYAVEFLVQLTNNFCQRRLEKGFLEGKTFLFNKGEK